MSVDALSMPEDPATERALYESTRVGVRAVSIRLAGYAIGIGASVLIARSLGPHGRGLYALPLAMLGVVMAVSHVGLEQSNIFLASRGTSARSLWSNGTLVAVVIGLVVGLGMALVAVVAGDELPLPAAWFAVALGQVPLLLLVQYWSSVLQLEDRYLTVVLLTLISIAVHAVAIGALAAAEALTPFRVLASTWIVNGLTWLSILIASRRAGVANLRPNVDALRRGLVFGLKVHGGMVAFFLLLRIDQLMVRAFDGFRALGLYSLAVTLAELLWLVTDPLAVALLPYQVRAGADDDRRLAFAMVRLSLLISATAAAVVWVLAPVGIRWVFGPSFEDAAWLLRWLLPGTIALAAARPLWAVLLGDGRAALLSLLGVLALTLNIVLNLALLPTIGPVGASVASSAAYVLLLASYVVVTRRVGVAGWTDLVPRRSDLGRLMGSVRRGAS